jgi:ATP-dependent DNA helicase RecG
MTIEELHILIRGGETSSVQFKRDMTNVQSIAQEIVAFANVQGGLIIVGVDDKDGTIIGLSFADIQRVGNLLTTAASNHTKTPVTIRTDTMVVEDKYVMIVYVPEGTNKPYMDNQGVIFVKNGADKRKVQSREEIARLLQSAGNIYADKMLIPRSSINDIDVQLFRDFYEKKFQEDLLYPDIARAFENVYLGEQSSITIAGNILFGKHPQLLTPSFYVTAIWFAGTSMADTQYLSSENIGGDMRRMFKDTQRFIIGCLRKIQNGKDFNSIGDLEIPEIVINEILVNALVHRDYYIHDSIKVFVFADRVEIKSPGRLPNSLTTEHIKRGISRRRNDFLASFAFDVLPYRGAGSGVLRSLQAYPHIDFENDIEAEEFRVIIHRVHTHLQ